MINLIQFSLNGPRIVVCCSQEGYNPYERIIWTGLVLLLIIAAKMISVFWHIKIAVSDSVVIR